MAGGRIIIQAKITKRVVDGVVPRAATYLVRDAEVKGFVLVVTPAGAKSYAVDYRAGSPWLTKEAVDDWKARLALDARDGAD